MDKQKQIEEMAKYCCNACEMGWGCDFGDCAEKGKDGYKNCKLAKETAEMIYNAGYRKIPENAVVLTDEELNEELDTFKCAMIVHDDDGERYVSYDDYKEFTDRLGKIARQRKVRIEQLEKLLDDRCDRCLEQVRKETAEKFAEKVSQAIVDNTYPYFDKDGKPVNIWKAVLGYDKIDEICKELSEGKV